MDAHCLFATREDLCHIEEEVKGIYATQLDHSERLVRLERRRQDDARMKNVWGNSAFPLSPLPSFGAGFASGSGSVGSGVLGGEAESLSGSRTGTPGVSFGSALNPGAEPFRGAGVVHTSTVHGHDDTGVVEPKRAQISRANSVRFDETSIQPQQSPSFPLSSYFPLASTRPLNDTAHSGSRYGFGCSTVAGAHSASQSSSQRSESRLGTSQSCKNSHLASATAHRQDSAIRLMSSMEDSLSASTPLAPPPGLLYLGPVPCIIRCWLTTQFSNDSLTYAAVCSGSYHSTIGLSLVRRLGLEDLIIVEPIDGGRNQDNEVNPSRSIKLPVYLPEASVYNPLHHDKPSEHHMPALTVYFVIREDEERADDDKSIQVVLGSDVLRAHNADILFSQDRVTIVDDERSKISIPLIRPENVSAYNTLSTASDSEWRSSKISKRECRLRDISQERPDSHEGDVTKIGEKITVEERSTSGAGPSDSSDLTKERHINHDDAPLSSHRTKRPSLSLRQSIESIDPRASDHTWQRGRQLSTSSQGARSSTDATSGVSTTLTQQENVRPKSRASERSWTTSSSVRHWNQGPWTSNANASGNSDVHANDAGVAIGSTSGGGAYQETSSNANEASTPSPASSVWGSWRRETRTNGHSASTSAFSRPSSTTEMSNRGARGGRTMKVLKPNKSTTTRQFSFSSSTGCQTPTEPTNGHSRGENGLQSSRWGSFASGNTAATQNAHTPTLKLVTSKMRSSANPVGGASAFGWLNNSASTGSSGDKSSE